jgi:phosphonoacetaldehyde hydrolase
MVDGYDLTAVVLDWAGTVIDHGCVSPVAAIEQVFAEAGMPVTRNEARRPMGLLKRDHVRAILQDPAVMARWTTRFGAAPDEGTVERLYPQIDRALLAILPQHCDLIPGVLEVVAWLREHGLAIGSSTGFTTAMMDIVVPAAAAQGYRPDALVFPDQVPAGRPAPYMMYRNALLLARAPLWSFVKIGDTVADVAEGRSAGAWTIALTRSGNEVGLPLAQWNALDVAERAPLLASAYQRLRAAGADYVVDSLCDCPPIIDAIRRRAAAGERPGATRALVAGATT